MACSRPRIIALFVALVPLAAGVGSAQQSDSRTVHGRITDPQGYPIADAEVTGLPGRVRVTTGADGRFRLDLPPGEGRRIEATARGYLPTESAVLAAPGRALNLVLDRAPFELPAVTVIGATSGEIAMVPGATAILHGRVLQDRAPVSVMDALRTVPGISAADEDPYGLNLNVGFRGLPPRRSSRTLLLEDGVPILLGPYGDPSMHYAPPVEALERVEIVKGSAQIMNGPQTLGGVINFVTRRPPADGTYGSATIGGGTFGYRNGHLALGTGRAGRGLSLDYTFREGAGVRTEQAHRFHNLTLNGLFPLGDRQSVLVKGGLWDEASQISETGLTQEEFEADPFSLPFAEAGRFDVRRYLGQVVHEYQLGRARLQTNVYVSNTNRASWRQSGESEERLGQEGYAEDFNCPPGALSYQECGNQGRPREYTVLGLEPRLSLALTRDGGSTLDVGGRLYGEEVRRRQLVGDRPASREANAALTRDNEITTRVAASYAQARIGLGAATLSPGLRVERVTQVIGNRFPGSEVEEEQSYTELLPGIGATYALLEGLTLFGGYHRGFAPPRPADVYQPEPGQPVVLVDPETSWNLEAGTRLQPRPGVRFEATFFRMDFGNQIIEAPAGEGQRFINGGRSLHQGIELGGGLSSGALLGTTHDLALSASYMYLPIARFLGGDGRGEDVVGNRLPYAPRSLASVTAQVAHRSGVTLGGSFEHTGSQFADDENRIEPSDDGQEGLLPAYDVVTTFGSYAVPGTRLQLRVSVRNVFDTVYISQRNEGIYTGMRRMVRTEMNWSF